MRSDEATHLEAVDLSTLTMGRPIGKGGFATIWFARWQGNDLAIKVFNVAARAGLSCTKLGPCCVACATRPSAPSSAICGLTSGPRSSSSTWLEALLPHTSSIQGQRSAMWFPLEFLAPGPLPPLAGCSLRWQHIWGRHGGSNGFQRCFCVHCTQHPHDRTRRRLDATSHRLEAGSVRSHRF